MLTGLNHITLTTSDLARSLAFYVDLLGFSPQVRWAHGAYLRLGSLWLCLSCDKTAPAQDYSHIAFSIDGPDFAAYCQRLREHGIRPWKENRSEGDSFYLHDPDGHQLEIHVGDLASRLAALTREPYDQLEWFVTPPAQAHH